MIVNEMKNLSIQMLRGLCIIVVFAGHTPPFYPLNAKYAVIVFLAMSSFLTARNFDPSDKKYILRKIIALVPLYYAFTLLAFCLLKIFPAYFHSTLSSYVDLIKSLLFIPYVYNTPSGSYTYAILNIGWYMNIQMWFYVFYYLFAIIFKNKRNAAYSMFLMGMYLICVIFFKDAVLSKRYALPLLCCSFGLIFHMFSVNLSFDIKIRNIYKILILICLFICGFILFENSLSDIVRALACCTVMFVFYIFDTKEKNVFTKIGDVNYEIYLSHYFVTMIVHRIIVDISSKTIINYLIALVIFIIVFYISKLIHYFRNKFTNYLSGIFL